MKILKAANPAQKAAWIDLWRKWDGKEVYAHPDYMELYTGPDSEACCAVLEGETVTVFYPFILRSLAGEPFCEPGFYDIVTAYGYGGPYVTGTDGQGGSIERFYREFSEWAQRNGVVSEFIRFALDSRTRSAYPGTAELNNDNVVVDLTVDPQAMWSGFKHKVRKNVNHARNSGLTVTVDTQGACLKDFLEIYYGTMQRRGATSGYYFPKEYFEGIGRLKGQYAYFNAVYEGAVVSTELVLVSDYNIYSFLGGTREEYFDLRPNDLLKYEIILWGRANGKRSFVLGGGYVPHDGIFNYKLAFAPEGACPFHVGKRVFMPEVYDRLTARSRAVCEAEGKTWDGDSRFFPLYRAVF